MMDSGKPLTSRTPTPRLASRMAKDRLKLIEEVLDDHGMDVEELLIEDLEKEDNAVENVDKAKVAKKQINPRVSFNAAEMTLNLFKQYSKLIFYADRELLTIHNPKNNAKHKGNEKQVYIEFSSGVFEALKKNMVKKS